MGHDIIVRHVSEAYAVVEQGTNRYLGRIDTIGSSSHFTTDGEMYTYGVIGEGEDACTGSYRILSDAAAGVASDYGHARRIWVPRGKIAVHMIISGPHRNEVPYWIKCRQKAVQDTVI